VYEEMPDARAIPEDPVEWARQIILLERTKTLLLLWCRRDDARWGAARRR
jgi:hypothetical protein